MADRPTDSQQGCLWRIPIEEVSLSELSETVMCIRLCKRPQQRESGAFLFGFFFWWGGGVGGGIVGDIIRDSLAVYLYF